MSAQLEKEQAINKIAAAAIVAVAKKRAEQAVEAPVEETTPAAPVAVEAVAPVAAAPATPAAPAPKEASLSARVIADHLRGRMETRSKVAQVAKVKAILQNLSPGVPA